MPTRTTIAISHISSRFCHISRGARSCGVVTSADRRRGEPSRSSLVASASDTYLHLPSWRTDTLALDATQAFPYVIPSQPQTGS